MIFSTSRYAGGLKGQMADRHSTSYTTYVFRKPKSLISLRVFNYEFRDGDRLDTIANELLGDPARWWEIMDINPEVHDPMHIAPGTVLRIPND